MKAMGVLWFSRDFQIGLAAEYVRKGKSVMVRNNFHSDSSIFQLSLCGLLDGKYLYYEASDRLIQSIR